MIPPWFQACINWKITIYLKISIPAIHLFYGTVIISLEHMKQSTLSRALCIFRNHQLGVCGWFEKIWRLLCLFEESNCSPALLKVPIYSTELVAVVNFCLQPPHSFMVNVLIWQTWFYWFELAAIHNICSEYAYSLWSENNQDQG